MPDIIAIRRTRATGRALYETEDVILCRDCAGALNDGDEPLEAARQRADVWLIGGPSLPSRFMYQDYCADCKAPVVHLGAESA